MVIFAKRLPSLPEAGFRSQATCAATWEPSVARDSNFAQGRCYGCWAPARTGTSEDALEARWRLQRLQKKHLDGNILGNYQWEVYDGVPL